jgi:threonine dehydrogenase-like Zn-dependent dehydrogenase
MDFFAIKNLEREGEFMRAITVTPMKKESLKLLDVETPEPQPQEILLEVLKIGICGTDRDIISGFYGESPPGSNYLTLGHESLSRVAQIGRSVRGFRKGELVVPTVRRNCPENCINCRGGESDMCSTGHYKEHGIKQLHGFASDYAITDSRFAVKLPEKLSETGVLLEPLTIVEKGLLQTLKMQSVRLKWRPKDMLVLGAGPVGLLATAILRLRGYNVHTVARRSQDSLKARLVEQTGATYVNSTETPLQSLDHQFDIVFELTGSASVALEAQELIRANGVACFLGIYRQQQGTEDAGEIFTDLVLGNKVHFGSVNANRDYFVVGAKDLIAIEKKWPKFLASLITKNAKPEDYETAYSPESEEEIKTVINFAGTSS